MTYNLNELNQLKSLAERLANNENNWALIQKNKELIKDALEVQISHASYFTTHISWVENASPEKKFMISDKISNLSDGLNQAIALDQLTQFQPATPFETEPGISPEWKDFYRLQFEVKNWNSFFAQKALNQKIIIDCQQLITDLERISNNQVVGQDFFPKLNSFLDRVIKKWEANEQLLIELTQIKQEKSDLENRLRTHDITLNETRQKLDKSQYIVQTQTQQLIELQEITKKELEKFGQLEEYRKIEQSIWSELLDLIQQVIDKDSAFWSQEEQQTYLENKKQTLEAKIANLKEKCQLLSEKEELLASCDQQLITLEKIITFHQQEQALQNKLANKEQELQTLRDTTATSTAQLRQEINTLKTQLHTEQEQFKNTEQNLRRELDKLRSELSKQAENRQNLAEQLITLTASSELLTQQVENLTTQLSESEQNLEQERLEKNIRIDLLRSKESEIEEQRASIQTYQQLIKTSEINLKKAQEIIFTKTEQLTKLEAENKSLSEELNLDGEIIRELETNLLNSTTQIQTLEAKIKDLESSNSVELQALKEKLTLAKENFQASQNKNLVEITRLKQQLAQAKVKETHLAQKIQELSKKPVKHNQIHEEKSLWETLKTPLLYFGGGVLILFGLNWIYRKLFSSP